MKVRNIKSIDVTAREYFDSVYGNSYFDMTININYGLESAIELLIPMQYGYGSQYEHEAYKEIQKQLNTFKKGGTSPFRAYDKYKIKYTHRKHEGFKERELMK